MNDALFQRIGGKLPGQQGAAKPLASGDAFDWFGQFMQSGLEGMGELVGIHPSPTTEAWRRDNPLAAFLSEVGGMAVPYVGWFGVTKKLKAFDSAINKIGDLNKHPFLTGAAREAARFAPFEAGRVLASQVVGDEDLGSMLGEATTNLALGAGVGGLLEGVLSAGTRAPSLARLAPGVDIAAPPQIQQRYIQELLGKGSILPENVGTLQHKLRELRGLSRAEVLPEGTRYVRDIEGALPNAGENLSRLFRPDGGKSGFRRRRFVEGQTEFGATKDWQEYATKAGLPSDFEDYGQFFRAVSFNGKGAASLAGTYSKHITRNLEELGGGWFFGREVDDGLFVMARKVKGDPAKADKKDEWVLFKTDTPGKFVPHRQRWANIVVGKNAWVPQSTLAKDGGTVYNSLTGFIEKFPLMNYRVLLQDPKGVAAALNKLLPQNVTKGGNELIERFKEGAKEYLAPARFQFTKSPRANWIHNAAKAVYDAAETEGQRLLYGELQLDPKKSIFWSALRGQAQDTPSTRASIKTLLDSLSDKEIAELHTAWRSAATGDALEALVVDGTISARTAEAARRLAEIDDEVWTNLNKVQKATGNSETKKRAGHFGVSHQWQGDTRIALRGGDGKVVAIASGFNRRGAQARAKELQETLAKEGTYTTVAEEFQISQTAKIPRDLRPLINSGGFLLEQQGVRGFRWDDIPWTRDELLETLDTGVRKRLKLQANLAVNDVFLSDLSKLAIEDPHAYKMLTARLNDMAGVQGVFGQLQNQLADQLLAPIIGQNSATRIAQITNSAMWHLQLGAGKLSYPIVNALTFLQTVMPEVAYITSAAPENLAGTYTYFAAGGTKGPVGVVGALNPLTMMTRSFKAMAKPDKALLSAFERATNERVIDPRLVEDYIGESATKVSDLRSAIKSPGDFGSWVKALSEFLPAQSERLGRAHAFTVGHLVAKDYLRIADPEAAYRFARQFTENTMYLYSAADRPRIFTTPAGTIFGLFKNWMMNYMGTLGTYTGEALAGNVAPLAWQTAGTFAVGGMAATPLYLVADSFSKAFSDKSMLELTYEAFNGESEWIGDGITYGLPPLLSGGMVSLYSQTATPIANPMRDASMLFSTAHLDRMQYLSKAMGTAWDTWQATGEHPGRNKRMLEELTRALAPVTMYRVMGAAQEGAISSLGSGYPVMTGVGAMDRLFYMAGFNTTELDKAYAVAEELFQRKEAHRATVARMGQAFAEAQLNKDSQAMTRVLKEAYASGVDVSSVLRSAQSRVAKMTTPLLERNFKAEDLAKFNAVLGGSNF